MPNDEAGTEFDQQPFRGDRRSHLCQGCQKQGLCRLGLREETLGNLRLEVSAICGPEFEGGVGVAHGGWICEVLDEVGGSLVNLSQGRPGWGSVTGRIEVKFLRPVPINHRLTVAAWVNQREHHRWHLAGEIRRRGTDEVLAASSGVWVERELDLHVRRTQEWLAAQDGP